MSVHGQSWKTGPRKPPSVLLNNSTVDRHIVRVHTKHCKNPAVVFYSLLKILATPSSIELERSIYDETPKDECQASGAALQRQRDVASEMAVGRVDPSVGSGWVLKK